jgi:trans-AT polyketide synthase, acyltransferase and oxidoreductase domains
MPVKLEDELDAIRGISASTAASTSPVVRSFDGPRYDPAGIIAAVRAFRESTHVVRHPESGHLGVALGPAHGAVGTLPALYPEWLGDRSFAATHGTRFAYVAGEMANGIATTRMVITLAQAGMLGFFGAAGLSPQQVEQAVDELAGALHGRVNWGVNLIHSPNEPGVETRVAGVLLRRGVPRISASAFMGLTPAVVRCSASGLHTDSSGRIVRRTQLFAKISRPEIAEKFLSPAPADLLDHLVAHREITVEEARLATRVPVAEDVTVEADSGGHTDNRPLGALFPAVLELCARLSAQHRYERRIRVGASGGLGSPAGVAAAYALGAAYVLTGSVNQACVESGISDDAKAMLAQADLADVMMAPAADMFELGARVQVLRRGTMFAVRSSRLYQLYRGYPSLEAIPEDERRLLEREVLGATVDEVWAETARFWQQRDPGTIARAEQDPKHRMALVFRWYLGLSSRWAIAGEASRRTDYQLWCGPAMGAFNQWAAGSFLAEPANRTVVQVARNLLEGAAVITRAQQLRSFGVAVPATAFGFTPRRLD